LAICLLPKVKGLLLGKEFSFLSPDRRQQAVVHLVHQRLKKMSPLVLGVFEGALDEVVVEVVV
jgi:hypothetical protein